MHPRTSFTLKLKALCKSDDTRPFISVFMKGQCLKVSILFPKHVFSVSQNFRTVSFRQLAVCSTVTPVALLFYFSFVS